MSASDPKSRVRAALETAQAAIWDKHYGKGLSAVQPETWVIKFDDPDQKDEVFQGPDAASAAQKRYDELSLNWSVTLLRSVQDRREPDGADAMVEQLTGTIAELMAARIVQNEQIERLTKALASQVDQKTELLRKNNLLAWELEQAVKVRDLAREASSRDLEASREVMYLQHRVAKWVKQRIGEKAMAPAERAMRLLEEAVELAQAEGITREMAVHQVQHVYERTAGEPRQEAGGVAVCLLGWCEATGVQLVDVARAEVERIEAKPIEEIRGSLARKGDAGLFVSAVPEEEGHGR